MRNEEPTALSAPLLVIGYWLLGEEFQSCLAELNSLLHKYKSIAKQYNPKSSIFHLPSSIWYKAPKGALC